MTDLNDRVRVPQTLPDLEQLGKLGKEITGRISRGESLQEDEKNRRQQAEVHRKQADDMFRSAGCYLIEAKKLVTDGFENFLCDHCGGLSSSRAYEYIGMAGGKITPDKVGARTSERVKKHRAAKKAKVVRAASVTEPAVTEAHDDEAARSADERKKLSAAAEEQHGTTGRVWPTTKARVELKYALDHWSPMLSEADRAWGLAYAIKKLAPTEQKAEAA